MINSTILNNLFWNFIQQKNGGCGFNIKKYENMIKAFSALALATIFIGMFILFVFPLPDTEIFINIYLSVMFEMFCFFGVILILFIAPKDKLLSLMRGKKTDEPYKVYVEYKDFNELKNIIVA